MQRYPAQNIALMKPPNTISNTNQMTVPVHTLIRQPGRSVVSQQTIPTIIPRQPITAGPPPSTDPVLVVMEIRMGLRKFETTSHNSKVTFQNDGVMFHVKNEGEFSPVLINTKSITRITINFQHPFPAMFVHLESSSIRQLKEIFNLSNEEFGDNNERELQRCLIFILTPNDITQSMKNQIASKCALMKNKFKRQEELLTIISPTQVLDLLFQTEGNFTAWLNSSPSNLQLATNIQTINAISARQPQVATVTLTTPRNITVTQQKDCAAASTSATQQLPTSFVSSQPEIVLPNNPMERQRIVSDLSKNGIYRVRDNGDSYIGMWNGSNFTKCQWHVEACRLDMKEIHIGSLVIKSDEKDECKLSGHSLNLIFYHENKKINFDCSLKDIVHIKVNIEKGCLFVEFGPIAMNTLRNKLKMTFGSEPYYGKVTDNESHKYFLICLKPLREKKTQALVNLKYKDCDKNVVREICSAQAARILNLLHESDSKQMEVEDEDDDLILCDTEIGIKCPITQLNMKDPVMNMICQHNYEKFAIQAHMKRKPNIAKCPATGCGNTSPITESLLQENIELKEHIQRIRRQ
ncbi:DgyrCDS9732 [Dimorphilus gyrociliatus]|uniref:E3 SUMO-protein ligase NSE2 n=1 Tax=Dimorphilus gyrociliatus TaxID=2664684 RepID=A0A7I8W358_9ANNE|nr:DgyrCDS9732 [Dimorphilus gyrociliatus]